MLIGGTAGTLIGLTFVVITLGMDHAQRGDEVRTRIFVTPILVYFTALLVISLAMVAQTQAEVRAVVLAVIGCAGFLYATSLAFTASAAHRSGLAGVAVGHLVSTGELSAHRRRWRFVVVQRAPPMSSVPSR